MLELVLALTPLLFIMALMILVGSFASWRVRNHATARQAALRSVWPKTTAGDASPSEWPTRGAGLSTGQMSVPLLAIDPFERHSAVRGPVYSPQGAPAAVQVDGALTDIREGVIRGDSWINRPPAIWSRGGFRTRFTRDFAVLGDEWEYSSPPMGYGGNNDRRGRKLYGIRFE